MAPYATLMQPLHFLTSAQFPRPVLSLCLSRSTALCGETTVMLSDRERARSTNTRFIMFSYKVWHIFTSNSCKFQDHENRR